MKTVGVLPLAFASPRPRAISGAPAACAASSPMRSGLATRGLWGRGTSASGRSIQLAGGPPLAERGPRSRSLRQSGADTKRLPRQRDRVAQLPTLGILGLQGGEKFSNSFGDVNLPSNGVKVKHNSPQL